MIMNVRSRGIFQIREVCLLFMVVAITRVKDVVAQSSTLDGPSWVDKDGNAIFTCTLTGGGTLRRVEWRNSSLEETSDINKADTIVLYTVGSAPVNRDPSHYAFDDTDPGYPLTVQSVTLDDESTYWCRFNILGTGIVDKNTQMQVRVPVDNTTMYISYKGDTYTNKENIDIPAGTMGEPFNCTAPGIKPGATVFVWTLDDDPRPSTGPPTQSPNGAGNMLTDSTSTVILDITDDATKPLWLCCATTNRQDGSNETEASICVTLNLIDPCQENPCKNGGTCANENGMPSCNCAEEFTGDTCSEKAPGGGLEDWEITLIAVGCVLAGLGLIGCGIYLCCTYNCCIWCGERCPWCREHCPCCRKPPKDREENIGMNNKGDV